MSHSTAHAAHHPALQHHFDTLEQQQNASTLGMWMFLVTEVLFFGGFFMAYILYRWMYNASFHEASHELNVWLGLFNTAVLIGSSLTMALAVRASKTGEKSQLVMFLILTLVLGQHLPRRQGGGVLGEVHAPPRARAALPVPRRDA